MKLQLLDHQKSDAIDSIQRYMEKEIDIEISELQAKFILDYFIKELAPFAYNKGIEDAQKFLILKAEELAGICFEEGLTYWDHSKKPSAAARRKPN